MASHLNRYPQAFLMIAFAKSLKSAFCSRKEWEDAGEKGSYYHYRQTAYHLRRKGIINIKLTASGKKFLELTKKGEMEFLMSQAWIEVPDVWDGKWRVIFFDIPENANEKRHKLRRLLLSNNFLKLQESVYISPYLLNRAAIDYLKKSGLINFIRIGRIEELDDDSDLRKKFKI